MVFPKICFKYKNCHNKTLKYKLLIFDEVKTFIFESQKLMFEIEIQRLFNLIKVLHINILLEA